MLFTTLLLVLAASANAQFEISTPAQIVQCEPALITFQGGVPPYFVSVVPGSEPGAAPIEVFPETSKTQLTWVVNVPAGSYVGLEVRDGAGDVQFSSPITVQGGSHSGCLA